MSTIEKQEGLLELDEENFDNRQDITTSFNKKIKQGGDGLDLTGKGRIETDFLGVSKDIVHDHIWSPPFQTIDQFQKIRNERIQKKADREKEVFGYNISEDRFSEFENAICKSDLKEKAADYKRLGVTYQGNNGANRAFSQRNRETLQDSQVFDRGQDPFKALYKKTTLEGHHDVITDYAEGQHDEVLQHFNNRKLKTASTSRRTVDFNKVLEQSIRMRKNLLHANQKQSVTEAVKTGLKNYNRKMATGGIREARGRFQGGMIRRQWLDAAQNANKANGDYEFTLDTKHSVNINADQYNSGTSGTHKDQENIDKVVEQQPVDDGKPPEDSINIRSVPTTI
jgi:hypothetical protein